MQGSLVDHKHDGRPLAGRPGGNRRFKGLPTLCTPMVTLRPHPHSFRGDTSLLLDLELKTGNVPLDGFAVELLFHTKAIEIADIYWADQFADTMCSVQKTVDNKHGNMMVMCRSERPYIVGPDGQVVATLCVRTKDVLNTKFSVGDRTQLYIHG